GFIAAATAVQLGFAAAGAADSAALWRALLASTGIGLAGIAVGQVYGAALGRRLGRIARETEGIAEGDLARPPLRDRRADEIGRTARAFDRLVASQRELVKEMNETVVRMNATAGQFLASAQNQERGSTEQSSRSEERRVGKECRSRWGTDQEKERETPASARSE